MTGTQDLGDGTTCMSTEIKGSVKIVKVVKSNVVLIKW